MKSLILKRTSYIISSLIIIGMFLYLAHHNALAQQMDKIIFNNYAEKFDMRPVVFTHGLHIKRTKCEVCHDAIFIKKMGANDINMNKNSKGQYCGKCHNGRDAYPLLKCERCHSGELKKKK